MGILCSLEEDDSSLSNPFVSLGNPPPPLEEQHMTTIINNSSTKVYFEFQDHHADRFILPGQSKRCLKEMIGNKVVHHSKLSLVTISGIRIKLYDLSHGSETVNIDGLSVIITHHPSGDTDVDVQNSLGG